MDFSDIKYGLFILTLIPDNDEEKEKLKKIIDERLNKLGTKASFTPDGGLLSVKCIQFTVVADSGFENLLEQALSAKPTRASTLTSTQS